MINSLLTQPMNENIHQILQKAGVAKGITSQEVMTLFVLGNDDLFTSFLRQIELQVSKEEFEKIKTVFNTEKKNVQQANKEYEEGLKKMVAEVKTDIFEEKIEAMAKMNPKDLELLIKTIEQL